MQPGIFVFWILCSIACYTEAGRFDARYGRTPFGWSKVMWAIVGFLLNVIGICLLGIAERIGRRAAAKQPVGARQAPGGQPPPYGQPVHGQPVYGQPVYGQPVDGHPSQFGQPAYGSPRASYTTPPAPAWGTLPPPPPPPPPPPGA
jgi:hypothetical protein